MTSDHDAFYIVYGFNILYSLSFVVLAIYKSFCNFKPFRKRSISIRRRGRNTPRNLGLCLLICYLIVSITEVPDPSHFGSNVLQIVFKYTPQYGMILSQCLLYMLSLFRLRALFQLTPYRLSDPVNYLYFIIIFVLFLLWTLWEIVSDGDRIAFDTSNFNGYLCCGLVLYNVLIAIFLIYSFNTRLSTVISAGNNAGRGSRAPLFHQMSHSESIALGNDMFNNDYMEMYEVSLSPRQSNLLDSVIRGSLLNSIAVICVQTTLILWALSEMEILGSEWAADFIVYCIISMLSFVEVLCVYLGFSFSGRGYRCCCGLIHSGCHLCCAKSVRIEMPRPRHKATDSIANYEFLM